MLLSRIAVAGVAIVAVVFWGPLGLPTWALIAFLIVALPISIGLSVKRFREERRVARSIWQLLSRR